MSNFKVNVTRTLPHPKKQISPFMRGVEIPEANNATDIRSRGVETI